MQSELEVKQLENKVFSDEELQTRYNKALQKLDNFMKITLDSEVYARWRVWEVLADGQAKEWKEIKRKTELNSKRLSRMLKVMLKEGSVFREVERTFPPKSTYKFYKQMVPVGTFLRRINGLIHQNLLNSVLEWNNEDYAKEVVAILRIVITEGMASDLFSYINRDFKEGPEIPFFTTIIRNLYYWAFYICITQTKERTQIAQKVFRDESQKLNEEYEIFEKQ